MISIIIRTYNEEKFLGKLLSEIGNQTVTEEFEIIIVDSGSTDGTLEIAEEFNCRITTIEKKNFTFGRSLNYGCRIANGDYFVFISAHCYPANKNWLSELVKPLIEDPKVALSYGRQIGNEITKFSEHQVFAKYFPESISNAQGGFFCNNASSAIKKELWNEHQFDEHLTGLEDMAWAKFFFEKGYNINYVPVSIIYHIHEETWRKVKIRYEREAYALKEIMPEIHFNILDFIRAVGKGISNDIIMSIRRKVLFRYLGQILMFRIYQFYGAYKGNHIHRKLSRKKKENYFYP